ncbi:MAG: hypothetical protein HYS89_00750 [Candidatus Colwellbacteria bacterium]|nr:hypothetical protein [Candidatus Colwellbacteria bacterium]
MDNFEFFIRNTSINIRELRDKIGKSLLDLRVDNIKQIRELIKQFIIISGAIIGFTIPVFGRTKLIRTPVFLTGGLIELLIVMVYAFYYLMHILESENQKLGEQHERYNKIIDSLRDNLIIFATSDKTEKDAQKQLDSDKQVLDEFLSEEAGDKGNKKDYALNIIFSAFLVGLVLIILSMINFQNLISD